MRSLVLLGCVVAYAACSKARSKPKHLSVDLSYSNSVSDLRVAVRLIGDDDNATIAEGDLEVSLRGTSEGDELPMICAGRVHVPASAAYGTLFDVHLIECPVTAAESAEWVEVTFTPRDGASRGLDALSVRKAFADVEHEVPPDPAVAVRNARAARLVEACKKSGSDVATATEVRAEAQVEIEKRLPDLEVGIQRGLVALLANPDPCRRSLGVYVRWVFSDTADWDREIGGAPMRFRRIVELARWPQATDLERSLVAELDSIGGGWIFAWAGDDPDRDPNPRLVVNLEVTSTDQITVEGVRIPSLEIRPTARLIIAPDLDEPIRLPPVTFEATGQRIEYTKSDHGDSSIAGAVVETMVAQLGSKLRLVAVVRKTAR